MTSRYATPESFKQALEHRLLADAKARSFDVQHVRQLFVFDRFLARLFAGGDDLILKGGLVLALRLPRARPTRDVDLRATGDLEQVLTQLRAASRLEMLDFLSFEVSPDHEHPELTGVGVIYSGRRFRAKGLLGGRPYGAPFGVDVVIGGPVTGDVEVLAGRPYLDFVGVAPGHSRVLPIEQHIAEKLHALTVPRSTLNSRVRDLPDLLLLASVRPIRGALLRLAIEQTFAFRATHPVPHCMPPPAEVWADKYAALARDVGLPWQELKAAVVAAGRFVDPVLAAVPDTWDPTTWQWT